MKTSTAIALFRKYGAVVQVLPRGRYEAAFAGKAGTVRFTWSNGGMSSSGMVKHCKAFDLDGKEFNPPGFHTGEKVKVFISNTFGRIKRIPNVGTLRVKLDPQKLDRVIIRLFRADRNGFLTLTSGTAYTIALGCCSLEASPLEVLMDALQDEHPQWWEDVVSSPQAV